MNKNILDDLFNTRGHVRQDELSAYLNGNAPSDVQRKVEHAMIDDPLYSDAIEGYQEMGLAAVPQLESFADFKKKLPLQEAKVIRLRPMQKLMRVAAVAAVLLISVFAYNSLQSPTPDTLFTDYYTHYENDISLTRRGDADGLNKDFKAALFSYAGSDFKAAMPMFEKALGAEPNNDAAHFFHGMACLKTEKYSEAVKHFGSVKSNYGRKAQWYAILATLKSGDVEKTIGKLNDFTKAKGYKSAEAKALLKELK